MGQHFSSEPVVDKETERDQNELFNVAVSSCQGWRLNQEDNHSLMLDLPGEHRAAFFAVYDGHGSARVSKHASEALWKHLTRNELYTKGNFKEALEQAFLTFDREVNESYNAKLAGTTAICVLIVDNVIYCANIGDSRAVASINCECIPLSHDHKPENPLELKRILAAGGYVLGNRVNGNLALSRAFGDFHYKGNDQLPPEQQIVSPCPDIKQIELNDDLDFIVLACDGIWDVLTSKDVVEFVISRLEQNIEPGLICEQLTTRCLATDYELVIGCDNMTVLLVCHTRGKSWEDYCTEIFEKNSKRLGVTRERVFQDVETLNQEVQKSRLLANSTNNRMNELHDLASAGSTSAQTSMINDQDVSSGSNEASTDIRGDIDDQMPDVKIRKLLEILHGVEQHSDVPTIYSDDEAAHITEVPVDDKELNRDEINDTNASSSLHLNTSCEEAGTTSSEDRTQNDDDDEQKISTENELDLNTENEVDSGAMIAKDPGVDNELVSKTASATEATSNCCSNSAISDDDAEKSTQDACN